MTTTNDQIAMQISELARQVSDQGRLHAVLQERVDQGQRLAAEERHSVRQKIDRVDRKVDALDGKLDGVTDTITGFVNRVEGGRIVIRWGWRIGGAVLAGLGALAYGIYGNWASITKFFVR